jgi:hypothetical protein
MNSLIVDGFFCIDWVNIDSVEDVVVVVAATSLRRVFPINPLYDRYTPQLKEGDSIPRMKRK